MDLFSNIVLIFKKGGLVMYPLLICSIIVVTIAIERFSYYRSAATDMDKFMAALAPCLESGNRQEAVRVCQGFNGVVAETLGKALQGGEKATVALQNRLEGAAALAAARLRERLNYLETIITLAPLLGLLGTVIGMIDSFSVMAIKSGQPHAITGGVGEALVATAAGLCVAIIALVAQSYFANRLDGIITDMEQAGTYVLDVLSREEVR